LAKFEDDIQTKERMNDMKAHQETSPKRIEGHPAARVALPASKGELA
jgi:hypothetical protein